LDVAVTLPPKTEQCGGELPLATETLDAAVQEALRAAHQVGIPVNEPCVLHNSRHVSIHLRPSKVVARVARIDATLSMQRIEREVAIARQLILRGAPIVGPVTRAPAGPFFSNGFGVTFWTYTEHVPADPENGAHVAGAADALRRMHAALAGYPAKLPPFMAKIEECGDVLMHPSALPALPLVDRNFLLAVYRQVRRKLETLPIIAVPIHGDAGAHNVFITPSGARYGDFEDVCVGPREWDIASLPDVDLASFEPVNRQLLAILRDLRSLCVSVWCWEHYNVPEKRDAAHYHLGYLRRRFAHCLP
jgi:Ser/Thr protein kinase RdoA (MazF antagonist)